MSRSRHANACACLALGASLLAAAPPSAQPYAAPRAAPTDDAGTPTIVQVTYERTRAAPEIDTADPDHVVRETLGKLVFARVSLEADDRPLREVLTTTARALRINLVPFFESPDRPAPLKGMVPTRRVSLYLADVDGRAALEAIAAQVGPEVTWQIQRGMIEFGPRETLGREDARTTRVFEVTDLAHEAPYFRPSGSRLMSDPTLDRGQMRLRPKDVVADLVRTITEQCEPDAFRPAPPPTEQEIEEGKREVQTPHTAPNVPSRNPRQAVNTNATRNFDPDSGPIFVLGRWAQIHVKDATLVVTAPDFVHRAIDGYPPAIPPFDGR